LLVLGAGPTITRREVVRFPKHFFMKIVPTLKRGPARYRWRCPVVLEECQQRARRWRAVHLVLVGSRGRFGVKGANPRLPSSVAFSALIAEGKSFASGKRKLTLPLKPGER
jgi:hypothetical protein